MIPNSNHFVSRAGEKLEYALREFNIDIKDKICADFGSSTGGFVDCLLKNGAKKVYSVDTAYGELAWKLRQDQRVVVMEKTNAIHVTLPEKMDLITSDTSWTKQIFVIPNIIANLKENGTIVTLIKPHYEADKKLLKKGILNTSISENVAKQVVKEIIAEFPIKLGGFVKSPIVGIKGGNTEYLAYFLLQ